MSKPSADDVPIQDLEVDALDALLERARDTVVESLVERKGHGEHTHDLCGFVWDLCDPMMPEDMLEDFDRDELAKARAEGIVSLEAGTMFRDEAAEFIAEVAPEAAKALAAGFHDENVFPVIVVGFKRCALRTIKINFGRPWARGGAA